MGRNVFPVPTTLDLRLELSGNEIDAFIQSSVKTRNFEFISPIISEKSRITIMKVRIWDIILPSVLIALIVMN